MASSRFSRALTMKNMNQNVRKMEYAVRGDIVARADELRNQLATGTSDLPFKEITSCNIGNPQALGQHPLTFFRQVLACCVYPNLLDNASAIGMPDDVVSRAETLLASTQGGLGAYSESRGLRAVRESVCNYIENRDSISGVDPESIYLINGASAGISAVLQLLISDDNDGIMIPIPQYPLYTATLALLGGAPIEYLPDEANGWALSVDELRRSISEARQNGVNPRALCVINPGNPTGQCLSEDNIRAILEFARDEEIAVLADEVYQTNVYVDDLKFTSFRKVLETIPNKEDILLLSFHSTSKGFVGECGMRGGYLEVCNLDPDVTQELYKYQSVSLCPNLPGQVLLETMIRPPVEGDPSFETYRRERDGILGSLKRRAEIVVDALNELDGITCNAVEGALYAFPRITFPDGALAAAKKAEKAPDFLYAMAMLEATGVCVVPGSGFGQEKGTYHFRTTILPSEDRLKTVMEDIKVFHDDYMSKFNSQ